MPPDNLARLDTWIGRQPEPKPSRPEALRRLADRALASEGIGVVAVASILVDDLNAPVLGLYGEADTGIPVETVERMKAALKAANKPSEIVLYPSTPHAFYADYRPSYREKQAKEAWKKMQDWFAKHGVK